MCSKNPKSRKQVKAYRKQKRITNAERERMEFDQMNLLLMNPDYDFTTDEIVIYNRLLAKYGN